MKQPSSNHYDVVIVGAGPAGLSAALMLGRCLRRVLVCDTGAPRNRASQALHGYLTRDGIPPREFLAIARAQLQPYTTVELRDVEVVDAECRENRFVVRLAGGGEVSSRKLLLATGVVDKLPDVAGLDEFYGRSVFHCPYCDGWEVRQAPIGIYGRGAKGLGLSLEMTAWSRDLVLFTDGDAELDDADRARLDRCGIALREDKVARLAGEDGILRAVVLANDESVPRRALFFTLGQEQCSPLATRLGCAINEKGTVLTGKYETTHLRGLFVAGDASRKVQWVVVAAAEGAEAAFAINSDLIKEDLAGRGATSG
jgi:thioredoxin reductase